MGTSENPGGEQDDLAVRKWPLGFEAGGLQPMSGLGFEFEKCRFGTLCDSGIESVATKAIG